MLRQILLDIQYHASRNDPINMVHELRFIQDLAEKALDQERQVEEVLLWLLNHQGISFTQDENDMWIRPTGLNLRYPTLLDAIKAEICDENSTMLKVVEG